MRIVVDLPDPLGPRKPVTVPGRTSKDRSSTATTLPNRLESPRASITRSALHGVRLLGIGENPDPGVRDTPLESDSYPGDERLGPSWPERIPTSRPLRATSATVVVVNGHHHPHPMPVEDVELPLRPSPPEHCPVQTAIRQLFVTELIQQSVFAESFFSTPDRSAQGGDGCPGCWPARSGTFGLPDDSSEIGTAVPSPTCEPTVR